MRATAGTGSRFIVVFYKHRLVCQSNVSSNGECLSMYFSLVQAVLETEKRPWKPKPTLFARNGDRCWIMDEAHIRTNFAQIFIAEHEIKKGLV